MKKILVILSMLSISLLAFSEKPLTGNTNTINENGTINIRGKVVDKFTGEDLAGVQVFVENTQVVAYTDLDGNFEIKNLLPGEYDIQVKYISYSALIASVKVNYEMEKVEFELENLN